MKWKTAEIMTDGGEIVTASAPYIISASRRTDIPAFYMDWFMHRLIRGYSVVRNPYTGDPRCISYANVRYIVFWSKFPRGIGRWLPHLEKMGIKACLQYTLNDYPGDIEPGVPGTLSRVKMFEALSSAMGKDHVVWRFDPLVLTSWTGVDDLIERVRGVGRRIHMHTDKLVFSFADIASYRSVAANMSAAGTGWREWTEGEMAEFAGRLVELNRSEGWNLRLAACGEAAKFDGVERNKCVDDDLIIKDCHEDKELMDFLGVEVVKATRPLFGDFVYPGGSVRIRDGWYAVRKRTLKDPGQRAVCGCMASEDVGEYGTCPHGCVYCYANSSADKARERFASHKKRPFADTIDGL